MGVGSGGKGGRAPGIFIHGTDREDRSLIVLFFDHFFIPSLEKFLPTPL